MAGSLYIHIPFCVRKCVYCDFLSVPFDEGLAREYTRALVQEIRTRAGGTLRTVYIGGGTPTVLPEESFREIFTALKECCEIQSGAEITVEANPGTVDREKAVLLRSLGVNRLSVGVQSFNDGELGILGRIHTEEQAVLAIRGLDFPNFSLDLIYGIPTQSLESWEATLMQALELNPSHISAYELTPEPGTPLMEMLAKGSLSMPGEDAVLEMASCAYEALSAAGYMQYEISNYARPGHECRHNLNYWHRGEYLGLGAGAYSFSGDRRDRNTPDINTYMTRLFSNSPPVENSTKITPEEALREYLFLGLRLTEGVDMQWFKGELGLDLAPSAAELIAEGWMEAAEGRLRLTRRGLMLFNPVVVRLMENLGL